MTTSNGKKRERARLVRAMNKLELGELTALLGDPALVLLVDIARRFVLAEGPGVTAEGGVAPAADPNVPEPSAVPAAPPAEPAP